jgi:hypothetical protein
MFSFEEENANGTSYHYDSETNEGDAKSDHQSLIASEALLQVVLILLFLVLFARADRWKSI